MSRRKQHRKRYQQDENHHRRGHCHSGVDRGELAALLEFAQGEIDTRRSCLKDAGSNRAELEAEISEGQDTIVAFEALLSERPKAPHLRKPYYGASDNICDLQNVLNEPNLCDDAGLLEKITQLSEALDALKSYMDEKYVWDIPHIGTPYLPEG